MRFYVLVRFLLQIWKSSGGRLCCRAGRGLASKGLEEQDRPEAGGRGQALPRGGCTGLQGWAWAQGQAGMSAHRGAGERSGKPSRG